MNRRRKRKKKIVRITFLLVIAAIIICLIGFFINKIITKDYISEIQKALDSSSQHTICTVSNISSIDTKVYSNQGIKYTNQHENINRLYIYDSTNKLDTEKILNIRTLLNNIKNMQKGEEVKSLPNKENGYYWLKIVMTTEKKNFISKTQVIYNFDVYYDYSEETIYLKNKYYDDFSKKNNGVKLVGYKADEAFKNLMDKVLNIQIPSTEPAEGSSIGNEEEAKQ